MQRLRGLELSRPSQQERSRSRDGDGTIPLAEAKFALCTRHGKRRASAYLGFNRHGKVVCTAAAPCRATVSTHPPPTRGVPDPVPIACGRHDSCKNYTVHCILLVYT